MAQENTDAAQVAQFSFIVPEVDANTVMRVQAPDGVTLELTVPRNVWTGDKLVVGKGEDGYWKIVQAIRTTTARPQAPPSNIPPPGQWRTPQVIAQDLAASDAVMFQLETTKGPIRLKLVPSWAPLGVTRFWQLVNDDFFSQLAIYRAVPGFLVQFGIMAKSDPRSNKYSDLDDDPLVGVPFEEGSVTFAAAGPGTRYGDMPQCGGNGPDPCKLEDQGNDYVTSEFPNCDFVIGASRVQ